MPLQFHAEACSTCTQIFPILVHRWRKFQHLAGDPIHQSTVHVTYTEIRNHHSRTELQFARNFANHQANYVHLCASTVQHRTVMLVYLCHKRIQPILCKQARDRIRFVTLLVPLLSKLCRAGYTHHCVCPNCFGWDVSSSQLYVTHYSKVQITTPNSSDYPSLVRLLYQIHSHLFTTLCRSSVPIPTWQEYVHFFAQTVEGQQLQLSYPFLSLPTIALLSVFKHPHIQQDFLLGTAIRPVWKPKLYIPLSHMEQLIVACAQRDTEAILHALCVCN